jgi:RHS repeat-associated protein
LTSVVVTLDTTTLNTITYSYVEGHGTVTYGNTSNRLLTLTQVFDGVTHTETLEYDDQGFIKKITNQSGQVMEYYYDNKGQLRRENNQIDNYTYIYNYDDYGNITSQYYYSFNQGDGSLSTPGAVEWYQYQYTWKDQISQSGWSYPYNPSANYTIDYTYDGAGNLISMDDSRGSSYDQSYTWEGRSLLTYTDGSTSASYTYNQNGIRDSKTVNGVRTTYYLDGTKVLYESDGTNNIYYTYDVDGTLISMNYNGSEYYYVFNALGDVTHLLDSSGDVVVEYRYDSYGNLDDSITLTGVGLANPYRYRSYRFDNETGYYYLQSRYYNPETGRFINSDKFLHSSNTTLGHNMFSYSLNNPIMYMDSGGYAATYNEALEKFGQYNINDENYIGGDSMYQPVTEVFTLILAVGGWYVGSVVYASHAIVGGAVGGASITAGGWIAGLLSLCYTSETNIFNNGDNTFTIVVANIKYEKDGRQGQFHEVVKLKIFIVKKYTVPKLPSCSGHYDCRSKAPNVDLSSVHYEPGFGYYTVLDSMILKGSDAQKYYDEMVGD